MNYIIQYHYENFDDIFKNIVAIRHRTTFKFMECVVEFYQFEDRNIIFWFDGSELSKQEIQKKMINAIKVLSFLFGLNLYVENKCLRKIEKKIEVNNLLGKKWKNNLQYVEKKISRFKVTKQFFYEMLDLINVAYENLYNRREEDAFIYFFKVIEKIAKKHYLIYMERQHTSKKVKNNKQELRKILKNYTESLLQVELTENMMDRKVDYFYKNIKLEFYGNIFNKISLFIKKKNIDININKVSDIVKARNKIAHGDYIEPKELDNLLYPCEYLANQMFSFYFFQKNYLDLKLRSYRYNKGKDIYEDIYGYVKSGSVTIN